MINENKTMDEIAGDNEFSQSSLLDLTEMKYTADQDFTEFYLAVRTHVSNHLKRRGDKVLFGSYELLEDEILSPTFEVGSIDLIRYASSFKGKHTLN